MNPEPQEVNSADEIEKLAQEYANNTTTGNPKTTIIDFIAGYKASQSKLTGTVFIKVSVKDRLPENDGFFFILNGAGYMEVAFFYADDKEFERLKHQCEITHWLEETAAPKLYSEEQMRKAIREYRDHPEYNLMNDDAIMNRIKNSTL